MRLSEDGFSALIPIDRAAPETVDFIAAFTCGTPTLDEFLIQSALDMHRDFLSRTSLLFHEDFNGLAGYITLTNDSIPLNIAEIGHMALNYNCALPSFPAVKVCRLGVHSQLQGQKIGARILDLATGAIVGTESITATRFLIADAINDERVVRFYERYGFTKSIWAEHQYGKDAKRKGVSTIKMIKDIYGSE